MHIEKQRQIRSLLREELSPFAEELGLYISGFEFAQGAQGASRPGRANTGRV